MNKSIERERPRATEAQTEHEIELELLGFEQWERAREREQRRKTRKLAHALNRKRQRQGHVDRAAWREAPATPKQLTALRAIATETGRTFKVNVNRGDAWLRIREATTLLPERDRLACSPPWYLALRDSDGKN